MGKKLWEVEAITSARKISDRKWEYNVKWYGYDSSENTWEPPSSLVSCDRLLESFWEHVGTRPTDVAIGTRICPKSSWIDEEIKFFEQTFKKKSLDELVPKNQKLTIVIPSKRTRTSAETDQTSETRARVETDDMSVPSPKRQRLVSSDPEESQTITPRLKKKGKRAQIPPTPPPDPLFSVSPSPEASGQPSSSQTFKNAAGTAPTIYNHRKTPRVKYLRLGSKDVTSGSNLPTKQRLAHSFIELQSRSTPIRDTPRFHKGGVVVEPPDIVNYRSTERIDEETDLTLDSSSAILDEPGTSETLAHSSGIDNWATNLDLEFRELSIARQEQESSLFLSDLMNDRLSLQPDPNTISPRLLLDPPPVIEDQDIPMMVQTDSFATADTSELLPEMDSTPKATEVTLNHESVQAWKWSGQLRLYDGDDNDRCDDTCSITLSFSAFPGPQYIDDAIESFDIRRLYDEVDLGLLLWCCRATQVFSSVLSQDEVSDDSDFLNSLASFMLRKNQVAFLPIPLHCSAPSSIDYYLVVFPSEANSICHQLRVNDLLPDSKLVATIISQKHLSQHSTPTHGRGHIRLEARRWNSGISASHKILPHYYKAIRILKLPDWLHDILLEKKHPYGEWWEPVNEPGIESTMLRHLLKHYRCENVGCTSSARNIFIHIGSLHCIGKMKNLADMRERSSRVVFYTYGTHESVPREHWGFREIFPIGGIVTFTPSAFTSYDPILVLQLIGQIAEHPLWACYILPSVLGKIASVSHGNDTDPLSSYDKGTFGYQSLLSMIEDGSVALMNTSDLASGDKKWFTDSRECLAYSYADYEKRYSHLDLIEQSSAIEKEISAALARLQTHPSFRCEWRRFVVIKGGHDYDILADKDGFEWKTLSKFHFGDDWKPLDMFLSHQ